ncbi:MAG: thiE [Verrucomicrobiaceae bacterium]|nr:thiE [Verrucomicrobiaceae bacterium]
MKLLSDCRLYGIVDLGYVKPGRAEEMAAALVEGGVDILQLRAKGHSTDEVVTLGRLIHAVTLRAGVPLVINDHPFAAREIGSEGVHVGQDDDAVARARAIVGDGCFVGKSTHSPGQAAAAQAEGADYIGFGPLYATGTKPDYLPIGLQDIAKVQAAVTVPVFCIGGVNSLRLNEVLLAGARRVVVVSAFLLADDVRAEVGTLKARLPI